MNEQLTATPVNKIIINYFEWLIPTHALLIQKLLLGNRYTQSPICLISTVLSQTSLNNTFMTFINPGTCSCELYKSYDGVTRESEPLIYNHLDTVTILQVTVCALSEQNLLSL